MQQGISAFEDLNGSGHERVAYAPLSVAGGTRMSAARAYLHRATRRPNLRLELHCEVRRIIFDGTTATGVEVMTPDGEARFTARREVIVCAGTMESPLLLERSGVGDPDVLAAGGVPMVAANPAVGENLRQHRGAVFALRLRGVPGRNRELVTPAARLRTTARYLLRRSGALAHGGTTVLAVLRSSPAVAGPDMEVLFTPVSVSGHDGTSAGADAGDGVTVGFYPHAPTSTGSIHLTGPSAHHPPRLVPGYLSTGHDRDLTVAAFRRVRQILEADPFASAASETAPGPQVSDDDSVLRYVLEHGFAGNHQVGTCALGPEGAVDDDLRVRGTQRLRVADASVMPTLTTGNTVAPSMAIGWIAGDLIRHGKAVA
ncbi:glucose-methanol-choline oxidoreductase [Actinoplanes friuliensis DSM 7358]|uniref:Glucose-methanol-choline oxidoreductase n=1 Tax=Actinoplanes friuliensis DSM 7358 TaxID=1246995 RepID=U5VVR8_9ACTN|nr:glucose-methanol-choline oxidoreductase [Actinoplanes friuliensis DSM 7358]